MDPEKKQDAAGVPEVTPATDTPDTTSMPTGTEPAAPAVASTPEEPVTAATPVGTDTAVMTEPVAETEAAGSKRTGLIATGIVVALLIIAGLAFWYYNQQAGDDMATAGTDYPEVVAVVNGEPVSRDIFMRSYQQAASIAQQQGYDPVTNADVQGEVEDQALNVAVNTALMLQQAEAAGITVSDEEVDAEVAKLEDQFGGADQLATALAGAGLDEASMRSDLREQLMIDAYITTSPEWEDVTVSDQEVQAYYDSVAVQMDDAPALADVRDQIVAQLESEKQQQATNDLIDRIRAEADIQENI